MRRKQLKESLNSYLNETVKIECIDGETRTGILVQYASEMDNEPDGASIVIQESGFLTEIYLDEIESCCKV